MEDIKNEISIANKFNHFRLVVGFPSPVLTNKSIVFQIFGKLPSNCPQNHLSNWFDANGSLIVIS